ncbi:MAG: protein kinase [Planctomycetes bacterium]|nr:protein kinase [Planctomycetota bacterium]
MVDRDPPSSQPTIPASNLPPTQATAVSEHDSRILKAAVDKGLITSAVAADAVRRATTDTSATELLIRQGLITKHIAEALAHSEGAGDPTAIAGFKIVGKLGQGGMGTVYRALQVSMHREVALKVISKQFASDPAFCDRFLREARAAGAVNHPNVITCFDVGQDQGWLYMALELMTGGDAAGLVREQGGRIEERRALRIIADCARGLSALKRAGLIHRDIKPANIFISEDGIAKLADLGLARATSGEDRMTMTGAAMGTPAFMSPEQASGDAGLDLRTDIYSLGATLFSLITGDMPFKGGSAFAVVAKVINDPTPDPRAVHGAVSDGAAAIIMAAMAKDRDRRYATPDLLIEDLERVLTDREPRHARITPSPAFQATMVSAPRAAATQPASGATVAVPPPAPPSSGFEPTIMQAPPRPAAEPVASRERRSKKPLVIILLLAVAVVVAVVAIRNHRNRDARRAPVVADIPHQVGKPKSEPMTIVPRADPAPAVADPVPEPAPTVSRPPAVVKSVATPEPAPRAVEPTPPPPTAPPPIARQPDPVPEPAPPVRPVEPDPAPVAVQPEAKPPETTQPETTQPETTQPETAPATEPGPVAAAEPAPQGNIFKRWFNGAKKGVGLGPKEGEPAVPPASPPPAAVPLPAPAAAPGVKQPAHAQLETFRRQLFERKAATVVEDAGDGGIAVRVDPALKSLDVLRTYPITKLDLTGCVRISDLLALHTMKLRWLSLNGCKEIESLKGIELSPLTQLDLSGCVSLDKDLSSLKGKAITDLRLANCERLSSLAGIEGMPLSVLDLSGCRRLQSLVQLQNMPLTHLSLARCARVTSLDGLGKLPLVELDMSSCDNITSVAPLRGLALKRLKIDGCRKLASLDGLQGMQLNELDLSRCSSLKDLGGLQGMKLSRLVLMRCDRLPGLTGMGGNPLTSLEITSCENLTGDLTALKGLPLTQLHLRACPNLGSLDGAQGLPLKRLVIIECPRITDLSAVRGIKDLEIIRPQ